MFRSLNNLSWGRRKKLIAMPWHRSTLTALCHIYQANAQEKEDLRTILLEDFFGLFLLGDAQVSE